jgi:hypothetical protein
MNKDAKSKGTRGSVRIATNKAAKCKKRKAAGELAAPPAKTRIAKPKKVVKCIIGYAWKDIEIDPGAAFESVAMLCEYKHTPGDTATEKAWEGFNKKYDICFVYQ